MLDLRGGARPDLPVHHPRPVARVGDRRPRRGHVPRARSWRSGRRTRSSRRRATRTRRRWSPCRRRPSRRRPASARSGRSSSARRRTPRRSRRAAASGRAARWRSTKCVEEPPLIQVGDGHAAACWLAETTRRTQLAGGDRRCEVAGARPTAQGSQDPPRSGPRARRASGSRGRGCDGQAARIGLPAPVVGRLDADRSVAAGVAPAEPAEVEPRRLVGGAASLEPAAAGGAGDGRDLAVAHGRGRAGALRSCRATWPSPSGRPACPGRGRECALLATPSRARGCRQVAIG